MLERLFLSGSIVSQFMRVLPVSLLAAVIFACVRRTRRGKRFAPVNGYREVALTVFVCYLTGLLSLDVHLVLPVPRHPRHRDWAAVCPGIQSGALDSPVLAGRADGRLLGAVYGLGQCVDVRAAGPTAPPHRPPCTVEEYALCVLWVFPAD